MDRSKRWRIKATLYRELGMTHEDAALQKALFVAAEVYSLAAERVAYCGTLADPSAFGALPMLTADGTRRAAKAALELGDESDEHRGAEEALPVFEPATQAGAGAAWNSEEGRETVMDSGYVRQQAAKYRKRAGEIADQVARLALLSLALTCEKMACDLEATEMRRSRAFRARKGH